jgi:hypothetical protein
VLFRPVYGPELEAIYRYVINCEKPVSRQEIYEMFVPHISNATISTQNIDDALSFLLATQLIGLDSGVLRLRLTSTADTFPLVVLRQLQGLALGGIEPLHETDRLYFRLLDELFIQPDRLFVADVHAEANNLRSVADIGGLSQEKIRAWQRVLSFLGLGHRVGKGFQCAVSPDLLLCIFQVWHQPAGYLQSFFEQHLANYLPFQAATGELSTAVEQSLLYLANRGLLTMTPRQDTSTKPYFGERRLRYIERGTYDG